MLRASKGFSTTTVLLTLGISVGSVTYIITNLLPKLQSEKDKASKVISYQIFMSSLTEYLVHALRERWCLDVNEKGETTLLQSSSNCLKNSSMEDVVSYKGNLERLFWDGTTIGNNNDTATNTIIATNQRRRVDGKTRRVLLKSEVEVPGSKMTFTVSNSTLKNMTSNHPLYVMTQGVKQCVDTVEITLSLVLDTNNGSLGEEKKIAILIKPRVSILNSLSCSAIRDIESTTYYTFYPRRLHTFSLLKYGNLEASLNHEYNGPVYVSGHLVLPATSSQSEQTSVFRNKLILGTYNGGGATTAGKIVEINRITEHTNFLRADPAQSKQNSYSGFRGFLGGVSFDSTEDRGFYNLFNSSSTDSSLDGQTRLQLCLDEQRYLVDKSMNANSQFGYKLVPSSTQTIIDLGFSLRNRFNEKTDESPIANDTTSQNDPIIDPNDPPPSPLPLAYQTNEGGDRIGTLSVTYTTKDDSDPKNIKSVSNNSIYSRISSFDVGIGKNGETKNEAGTRFRLKINGTYYYNQLNKALTRLKTDLMTCSINNLFPGSGHPLYKLPQYIDYDSAAKTLTEANTSYSKAKAVKKNSGENSEDCSSTNTTTNQVDLVKVKNECFEKLTGLNDVSEIDKCVGDEAKELIDAKDKYDLSYIGLINKLDALKAIFEALNIEQPINSHIYPNAAELVITLNSLRNQLKSSVPTTYFGEIFQNTSEINLFKDNKVLNQKRLIIEPSQKWRDLFKDEIIRKYVEYEVGQINLVFKLEDLSSNEPLLNLTHYFDADGNSKFYLSNPEDLKNSWASVSNGTFFTTFLNGTRKVPIPMNTLLPQPQPATDDEKKSDIYKGTQINNVFELNCPEGLGLPDWDLDMSWSSNFAWNYANTPAGVNIQKEQNKNAPYIIFAKAPSATTYPTEGSPSSYTKSVVDNCIVESDRNSIYGFYVCKTLTIRKSSSPLTITGTFIVNDLVNEGRKVYWYSIWDPTSANRILTDFYSRDTNCQAIANNQSVLKLSDVISSEIIKSNSKSCSALNLVINGPNNFSWTSVDPEIGLANPTDAMTTQKINRVVKWVVREEAKMERIK